MKILQILTILTLCALGGLMILSDAESQLFGGYVVWSYIIIAGIAIAWSTFNAIRYTK